MNALFLVAETVIHPEDHAPILLAGRAYCLPFMRLVASDYGIDNIKGTLILGETVADQIATMKNLGAW